MKYLFPIHHDRTMQGDLKALQPLRLSTQEPYNLYDDNPDDWSLSQKIGHLLHSGSDEASSSGKTDGRLSKP